jgi:predicted ATP-grasp superfamily ATP-dependent carboligase
MNGMDVLVTGAEQRHGLAVIRALGSRGLKVLAAGLEPKSLGFVSRYAAGVCQYPSPVTDKREFIGAIAKAVEEHRIPVVIPVVEPTAIALDEFRGAFEGLTKLALPPSETLCLALDKKKTLGLAQELNIPIPRSCFTNSKKRALSFAAEVGFPVVMKPRAPASYARVAGDYTFKVAYARDRQDLTRQLESIAQVGDYPILQEYCPGVKTNQGLLYVRNELLGLYQYKGVREEPLTGGVTCLHMSVPVDSELQAWTLSLLRAMQWDGAAMIEYKVDELTGKKVLMEVNGRFWAPLSAANKLGLNFPYALYRYVKDGVRDRMPAGYPIGKRNRYLRGDLAALAKCWLGHDPDFLVPASRGKTLCNFLGDFHPAVQYDILDFRDPRPGIREILSLCRAGGGNILRHLRTDSGPGQ